MTRQIKYKGTGELRAHWCRRCENQHCYSRTGAGGARTSTVTVALVPAVRARTSTVTVALVPAVREPVLLQSHWCENQHCYCRTGARTSTIAEQYWDRQAVTVTLRAALTTRHGTSARPVQMVMQGKKPKVMVQQKWRTVPALVYSPKWKWLNLEKG